MHMLNRIFISSLYLYLICFLGFASGQVQVKDDQDCLTVNGDPLYIYAPHLFEQIHFHYFSSEDTDSNPQEQILEYFEPFIIDGPILDSTLDDLLVLRSRPDEFRSSGLQPQHVWYKQKVFFPEYQNGVLTNPNEDFFQWGLYLKKTDTDIPDNIHSFICAPSDPLSLPKPTKFRVEIWKADDGGAGGNLASGP